MPPRDEISVERILGDLFAQTGERLRHQQDRYRGRWTRVVAEVRNVYRDDPTAATSVFAIRKRDPRAARLDAGFLLRFTEPGDKLAAAALARRQTIEAIGRVDECADQLIVLSDCRLAERGSRQH